MYGRLTVPVRIEAPPTGRDEAGQPLTASAGGAWSAFWHGWANIRHLSGTEAIRAGAESAAVRASVRVAWVEGVTASMRLVDEETQQTYEIEAVLPDKTTRRYTDLVCRLREG